MGAFSGGLTFRQYTVKDPLPDGWADKFREGIRTNAFKDIDLAGEADRSIGWCDARFPLDVDLEPEQYQFDDHLVLGLRTDVLAVPGPLLKLHTEAETRKVTKEQGRESLNRYEKAEIKERVKLFLREKMMPSVKSIDMVWSLQLGIVRFFAGSEKANLEFMELFEDTFGLQLIPDAPYTAGLFGKGVQLSEAEKAALDTAEPTPFIDPETAARLMMEN